MQSGSDGEREATRGFEARGSSGGAPTGRELNRSQSKTLLQCGMREDITDTKSLVAAYNAATDALERKALRRWLTGYLEWFDKQTTHSLSENVMGSYVCLADVKLRDQEDVELVRRFFLSVCNKMARGDYGDTPVVQAMEVILQTFDVQILRNDPSVLLRLAHELLSRLGPAQTFTKNTYSTHGPTLFTLHQIFIVMERTCPNELDASQEDGAYKLFKAKLAEVRERQMYYPFLFYAEMIEHSIDLLSTKSTGYVEDLGRRAWSGMSGCSWMCRDIRSVMSASPDTNSIEVGCRALRHALTSNRTGHTPWYDLLEILSASILISSRDSQKAEMFEECYLAVSSAEESTQDDHVKRALRFGMMEQLCAAVMDSMSNTIRERAALKLTSLGAQWIAQGVPTTDPSMFALCLEELRVAYVYGRHRQLVSRTLEKMMSESEDTVMMIFKDWLGNNTLRDKLEGQHLETEPDTDVLFEATRDWLGLTNTSADLLTNLEDLRERYKRSTFATDPPLFESVRRKSVEDLKHHLVYYEQESAKSKDTIDDEDIAPIHAEDQMSTDSDRRLLVKKPISVDDLFKRRRLKPKHPAMDIRTVLIYGNPGTGKTSLSKKIAHTWAKGLWGREFKVVYLLPMREVNAKRYNESSIRSEMTIETVIANHCFSRLEDTKYNSLRAKIEEDLHKKTTLVILDGFDERDGFGKAMGCSAMECGCKLLLLSRPYNLHEEREVVDIEIECLGLSDFQLAEFVGKELKSGAKELLAKLRGNPSVWEMAHIPVTIQTICFLWRENRIRHGDQEERLSLLFLYSRMVETMWERYVGKIGREPIDRDEVFDLLEQIAFESLRDGQILIDQSLVRGLASSGTLRIVARNSGLLVLQFEGLHFQFPHLTFHEFFCGKFLSRCLQSPDEHKRKKAVAFISESKYIAKFQVTLAFMMLDFFEKRTIGGLKLVLELVDCVPQEVIGVQHAFMRTRLLDACLANAHCRTCELHELVSVGEIVVKPIGDLLDLLCDVDVCEYSRVASYLEKIPNVVRHYPERFRSLVSHFDRRIRFEHEEDASFVVNVAKQSPELFRDVIQATKGPGTNMHTHVRMDALEHIGALLVANPDRADEVVEVWREGCRDKEESVRRVAVKQFGTVVTTVPDRASEFVELLKECCKDAHEYVREAVPKQICAFVAAISDRVEEFVDLWCAMCVDEDEYVRKAAVEQLGALMKALPNSTDEFVEFWRKASLDENKYVRAASVRQISDIMSVKPELVDEFLLLWKERCMDGDWHMRQTAANQVCILAAALPDRADELVELWTEQCTDVHENVREAAMKHISALVATLPDRIDPFIELWTLSCVDGHENVREAASKHVGALVASVPDRADEVVELWKILCVDTHTNVQRMAMKHIADIAAAVPGRSDEIIELMRERCRDGDGHLRRILVEQIGSLVATVRDRTDDFVELWKAFCTDEEITVLVAAVKQIGALIVAVPNRVDELVKTTMDLFAHKDRNVHRAARGALELIPVKHLIDALGTNHGKHTASAASRRLMHVAITIYHPSCAKSGLMVSHEGSSCVLRECTRHDVEMSLSRMKIALEEDLPGFCNIPDLSYFR